MKKISLILCAVLLISCFGVSASANIVYAQEPDYATTNESRLPILAVWKSATLSM